MKPSLCCPWLVCLVLWGCAGEGATQDPGLATDTPVVQDGMPLPEALTPEADAGAEPSPPQLSGDAGLGMDGANTPVRQDLRCTFESDASLQTDYRAVGPHGVATLELVFEDRSRPITANDNHAAAPSRILNTRIYYPAVLPPPLFGQTAVASGGPFPLLMYSHGYSSSREESNRVGNHAASHGFVVVAPDYPLTNIGANGGNPDVNDVASQPADVSFLVDQVLALSADSQHLLSGAVDSERIGALGVSLGGLTTLLVGYHAEKHDPRVTVVAPIAAPSFFFAERYFDTRELPMLLFHGDNDAFIDYQANARTTLERAAPSVRLLTVTAGSHTGFGAPVDGALLGLVAPLYAPPDAHPNNPDGLGCGYVAQGLADTGPEFVEGLGGPEVGVEFTEEQQEGALPCTGDEYKKPAIDLNEQMSLLAAGVASFFTAHFGGTDDVRQSACRFLVEELPKEPDVTLE